MTDVKAGLPDNLTIHWPEPAHLRLDGKEGNAEPCEIEFNDGTVEHGELLRFTGRDEHLVFRPHAGHARYPSKIVVRNARFKRLRLTDYVVARPLDASLAGAVLSLASSQVHVYNVEFNDHQIESGDTTGYVRNAIGLFLYFSRSGDTLERVFIPESAIAYFQAGEAIGRVLIEENAVSEEQLQAAVDRQQEMRKLVLGDYLIEEGLITAQQLDDALLLQGTRPSLRLGEALIELGAVQPEALQIALSRQRANRGRPLGQILIDMGVVDADTLNKIHAKKMGHHFVSLANFTVSEQAIQAVSATAARRLGIVPLSVEHGDLIVAAESQLDSSAVNELTLSSRMRVVQVLASGQEIRARRTEAYGELPEERFLADSPDVHFEVIEAQAASDDDALALAGARYVESVDGANDPHLLEAIERALAAVEQHGTLDIHVETRNGVRITHIKVRLAD